jgi:hypothetical protein
MEEKNREINKNFQRELINKIKRAFEKGLLITEKSRELFKERAQLKLKYSEFCKLLKELFPTWQLKKEKDQKNRKRKIISLLREGNQEDELNQFIEYCSKLSRVKKEIAFYYQSAEAVEIYNKRHHATLFLAGIQKASEKSKKKPGCQLKACWHDKLKPKACWHDKLKAR